MKKKARKLTLNRETLSYLGGVVGGGETIAARCQSLICGPPDDGGGSYATCAFYTCGVCSGNCATGGACTT